jgi:hypothetical protein
MSIADEFARTATAILATAAVGGVFVVACWAGLGKLGLVEPPFRPDDGPNRRAATSPRLRR